MPTFDTPEPISVSVTINYGNARVIAGDRTDTVVDVRPSRPNRQADVTAAEQTTVELVKGQLVVRAPKRMIMFGRGGSIDVTIEVPTGSTLQAEAAWAGIQTDGRLGDCTIQAAGGDVQLGDTGRLDVQSAHGSIVAGDVDGDVEVSSASSRIRIGDVAGSATIQNSSGDISLGAVEGDVKLSGAHGDLTIDRALRDVTATTASGGVRIGELVRGEVNIQTAYGRIDLGIREGTAAWLDLFSKNGTVRNYLEEADRPDGAGDTVEVRARTNYGDISIRRP
ncbi:DUF4097 family beta strand repeat-containing protein [Fodinicola acaciae]|uniref:DUF4097 family beta strand repeat-containing protein n=1 Tax=Fodinicola acaciae TaxID=2681555 RepID=UPI0013D4C7FB|nr:DUF4097 family beta strand repeat-containing protein [Fodinicola acaciae]